MVCCICRHSLFSGCSYNRSSGDPYLSISLCEDKERVADISIGDLVMRLQGFRWAIEHDRWQGRVDSIKDVFEGDTNQFITCNWFYQLLISVVYVGFNIPEISFVCPFRSMFRFRQE